MSNPAKAKGYRGEKALEKLHNDNGIECTRVPLSGAAGNTHEELKGDLRIIGRYTGEVKSRKTAHGWNTLLNWIGDSDFLFLKVDRQKYPTVIMHWDIYLELMMAERDARRTINGNKQKIAELQKANDALKKALAKATKKGSQ
jgi:hypothetical protein